MARRLKDAKTISITGSREKRPVNVFLTLSTDSLSGKNLENETLSCLRERIVTTLLRISISTDLKMASFRLRS